MCDEENNTNRGNIGAVAASLLLLLVSYLMLYESSHEAHSVQ